VKATVGGEGIDCPSQTLITHTALALRSNTKARLSPLPSLPTTTTPQLPLHESFTLLCTENPQQVFSFITSTLTARAAIMSVLHFVQELQTLPFTLIEPESSGGWESAMQNCKFALIKQFANYEDLEIAIKYRQSGSIITSTMIEHFTSELRRLFGCEFTATLVTEHSVYLIVAQGTPKLSEPLLLSKVPAGADDWLPQLHVGQKKIPRPMNCFMLYRDYMHKRIKAAEPNKSVQEICKSSEISESHLFACQSWVSPPTRFHIVLSSANFS
jgi:hypothetical protein